MASILFIAPADLGETVLATGALARVVGEGDAVDVLCSPPAKVLFRALPQRRTVLSGAPGQDLGAYLGLGWPALTKPYDTALDLRGSPVALAISARRRLHRPPPSVLRHAIEEFAEAAGADAPAPPKLWLDDIAYAEAAEAAPVASPVLVLAPGGSDAGKRWPEERFAAVARRLVYGPLADARVVLLGAGSRDVDRMQSIASSLDADGIAARAANIDLLAAAALLERATLCLGNDNALTHIAAAMGAPTLTLFGPTDERVRAPYGKRARTLRGREYEAIIGLPALEGASMLEDISVDAAEAAALDLLNAGGLR